MIELAELRQLRQKWLDEGLEHHIPQSALKIAEWLGVKEAPHKRTYWRWSKVYEYGELHLIYHPVTGSYNLDLRAFAYSKCISGMITAPGQDWWHGTCVLRWRDGNVPINPEQLICIPGEWQSIVRINAPYAQEKKTAAEEQAQLKERAELEKLLLIGRKV